MAGLRAVQPIEPAAQPALAPIPVARPRLPAAEALVPYLRRMDEARWYSNFGPLICEFEARLAARFQSGTQVVTTANATQGLALTLRAMDLPRGGLCVLPAYTFVATAHAVIEAGLTPCFLDVDAETWMLDPVAVRESIRRAPGEVVAAVPVAAFGAPFDIAAWRAFRDETGTPVLVDAAAAFDTACDGDLPLVVSLHATKALGIGEGGFLATQDAGLALKVRQLTTYGFHGTRESLFPATNAKLSEYAGAVGLAALDAWPQERLRHLRAGRLLRAALTNLPEVRFQTGWGVDWVTSVCSVRLPDGSADRVEQALADEGVQTRRWWGPGCHRSAAFADAAREALPATERLGGSVIGLPFAVDLTPEEIDRIADTLGRALAKPAGQASTAASRPHPYADPRYVKALSPEVPPFAVPEWGAWLTVRRIPAGGFDAAGSYPLTPLPADADLEAGLERCRAEGLVSVVLVADPLASPAPARLGRTFELCRPFKTHFLVDPAAGAYAPSKHHRERIRRGHRRCRVELVGLSDHLPAWRELYRGLAMRRGIRGAADFSPAYFEVLAEAPAIRAFAAYVGETLAGMTLWFEHDGVVYNHLTAANALGYANGANFALYDAAVAHFLGRVVNLGGAAGGADTFDGLAQFKAGFANAETTAHLCGAVLDRARYDALSAGREGTAFFPAYRAP